MKNAVKEIFSTILYILAVLLGTWLIITFVGQRTSVSGSSMEPTLHHGDQLIMDKLTYHFSEPERFDIIVFPFQYEDNTYYVKRVIGLPGDTIKAQNGVLYRKNAGEESFEIVEEPYLGEIWTQTLPAPGEQEYYIVDGCIVVPEGMVYVMGDHRSVSSDSRSFGPIPMSSIVGVVTDWSLKHKKILTAVFGFFQFG